MVGEGPRGDEPITVVTSPVTDAIASAVTASTYAGSRTLGQVETPNELVIDGDGPLIRLLCGGFPLNARHPLIAVLPHAVHSTPNSRAAPASPPPSNRSARRWTALTRRAGGHRRLARALYDQIVGGALSLIHQDPARRGTVNALAEAVATPLAAPTRLLAEARWPARCCSW